MEESDLIHKTAYSLEGKWLGDIIRIEGTSEARILDDKPHLIIKIDRFLADSDIIEISIDRIITIEKKDVFLDIPIKEFRVLQKAYRAERKYKVKVAKAKTAAKEAQEKAYTRAMTRRSI